MLLATTKGALLFKDMIPLGLDDNDMVDVNVSVNILTILTIDEVVHFNILQVLYIL